MGGGKKQILNKLIAYLVPYVFFSLLWWSFKLIFSGHVNSSLGIRDLLLIFVYPLSFMWFIYALLVMVVVQVLVDRWVDDRKFAIGHLLVALLLYLVRPYVANALECISFSDMILNDIMRTYIYFLLGFYSYQRIINLVEGKGRHSLFVLSGLLLLVFNLLIYNGYIHYGLLLQLLLALCGCTFMLTLCRSIESVAIFNYIGKRSLAIYVLQGMTIAATRQALALVWHPTSEGQGWLPFIVCATMGTILPMLVYNIATRIGKLDFVFMPTKYIKF